MAVSIGPKGWLELIATEVGPERNVRVISFPGRADTGFIPHPQFRAAQPPVAIVNVRTGKLMDITGVLDTGSGAILGRAFGNTVNGGISQLDTGIGNVSGQTFFAIVTDTGTASP